MCFSTPQAPLRCFHFSFFPLSALEFQGELTPSRRNSPQGSFPSGLSLLRMGSRGTRPLAPSGGHCCPLMGGPSLPAPLERAGSEDQPGHPGPARLARPVSSLECCSLGGFVLTLLVIWSVLRGFTE